VVLVVSATTPIRCSTRFLTPSLMQIFKKTASNEGSRYEFSKFSGDSSTNKRPERIIPIYNAKIKNS
jgi:hypothetical protein